MSWWQLKDIRDADKKEAAAERSQPPLVCPNDGTLLRIRANGERACQMGDYRWNG